MSAASLWKRGLCALVLVGGITACQQPVQQVETPAAVTPTDPALTMAQNGERVDLQVGQPLTVALPGAPDTGYVWQVVHSPKGVQAKQKGFQSLPVKDGCALQQWQFVPTGAADGLLTLAYRHQSGHDDDIANYYTLRLHVR